MFLKDLIFQEILIGRGEKEKHMSNISQKNYLMVPNMIFHLQLPKTKNVVDPNIIK